MLPSFLQTLFTNRQSSLLRYQSDLPSLGLWRRIPIGQSPLLSLLSQDIVGKIHTCRRSASLMGWFHGRVGLGCRLGRIGGIQFRRKSFRWYVLVISSDSAICLQDTYMTLLGGFRVERLGVTTRRPCGVSSLLLCCF